jgi:3-oxoacyl-[acyl-carrier protein] reductase
MAKAARAALVDRVAIVTGASRGIGRAIADRLLGAGARVGLLSRHADALEATTAALRAAHSGAAIASVAGDVASSGDVARFAARVRAELGPATIVVNNAGIVVRASLDETSEADWDAVVDANLKGTYLVSRAFLPDLRARGAGRVVNIASISGRQGTARLTAYCAAKHGVVGFTRALAEELRPAGVQVNAVCPGSVDTDMLKGSGFPALMTPDDVAGVVLWLATDAPAALTGACIDVFG